jgi:type IV secretion system protein VirB9
MAGEPSAPLKREPAPALPDTKIELTAPPPLPQPIQDALKVSEEWQQKPQIPARGKDGSVVYTYGQGLATIVCAPLRVCFLELEPGERIIGEPSIGDSTRWTVSPGLYGGVEEGSQVVIFKPQDAGLDTNLLVLTDRRAYFLRLMSVESEYIARTAFTYPEDQSAKWKAATAKPPEPEKPQILPAIITAERLNFSYSIEGGNAYTRPRRVFDDGQKTYLQMPEGMEHREAPALLVMGADGKGIMTNYRVQQGTYIVDALFDEAQLRLGTKKKEYVTIKREDRG